MEATANQSKYEEQRRSNGLLSLVAYGPCDIYHGECACYVDQWYYGQEYRKDPTLENLALLNGAKQRVAWYETRVKALGGFRREDVRIKNVLPDGTIVVDDPLFRRSVFSGVADRVSNKIMSYLHKY